MSVCEVLGGTSETNYWQSLGNSYPITGALSLTALWENQPPTPATEKKDLRLSSPANELAPTCERLLLTKALQLEKFPHCLSVKKDGSMEER